MASIEKRADSAGVSSYRVKVRLRGFPPQSATFERITDAKKWAQDTESAIRDGRYFKTAEASRHTLAELVDRYMRDVVPSKPRSGEHYARCLAWWKAEIGFHTLAQVTPSLLAEYRDKLATTPFKIGNTMRMRSPSTVVRYLAALSHAFTIAVKEWGWLDDSPMRKVSKPKEPRGRVRFLADDERIRLLAECKASINPDLYCAVVLALSTGARRMELMGARWSQVDTKRGVLTLHETKNGERRALPLTGHALELVKERAKVRRLDSDLLFPGKNPKQPIDFRTPFEGALKRANIDDFRWHDLRHSCASYLAMNGASLAEIAEVLGHKTLQMVKRYAHLSHAHTAKVVESMNTKIFGV